MPFFVIGSRQNKPCVRSIQDGEIVEEIYDYLKVDVPLVSYFGMMGFPFSLGGEGELYTGGNKECWIKEK